MFSAITNILSTSPPRHAEENDVRQEIQRHDPEYERRKKKKKPHKNPAENQDEATILSIGALRLFLNQTLEQFIESSAAKPLTGKGSQARIQKLSDKLKASQPQPSDYKIQQEMNLGPYPYKISANAAKAASIYQRSNASSARENTLLQTTDLARLGPTLDLSATDLRMIHLIIDDLRILAHHNIEKLSIHPAESFLQSLKASIDQAKLNIE